MKLPREKNKTKTKKTILEKMGTGWPSNWLLCRVCPKKKKQQVKEHVGFDCVACHSRKNVASEKHVTCSEKAPSSKARRRSLLWLALSVGRCSSQLFAGRITSSGVRQRFAYFLCCVHTWCDKFAHTTTQNMPDTLHHCRKSNLFQFFCKWHYAHYCKSLRHDSLFWTSKLFF